MRVSYQSLLPIAGIFTALIDSSTQVPHEQSLLLLPQPTSAKRIESTPFGNLSTGPKFPLSGPIFASPPLCTDMENSEIYVLTEATPQALEELARHSRYHFGSDHVYIEILKAAGAKYYENLAESDEVRAIVREMDMKCAVWTCAESQYGGGTLLQSHLRTFSCLQVQSFFAESAPQKKKKKKADKFEETAEGGKKSKYKSFDCV